MALTPGLEIPFGVQPVNPVPVDSWSGPYSGSIGNDNETGAIAAANAAIPLAIRFQSMEVRLIYGGVAYKYWYRNGTDDNDLTIFAPEVNVFFSSSLAGSIYATGSTAFVGNESGIVSPQNKGSDVFFYVSGSAQEKSLFGGDVVVSGALNILQGFSGSLTKLNDGTSYLVAGHGIDILSASNGSITISTNAASIVAGSDTQVQFNDGGIFGGVSGFTFDKNTNTLTVAGDITGSNSYFTNLTVVGTASIAYLETVNQQSLIIGDKYITIASGAFDHTTLDGSGILFGSGVVGPTVNDLGSNAHILYRESQDALEIFPGLDVSGSFSVTKNAFITGSLIVSGSVTVGALSGSLTQLSDGTSYLVAGTGIDIISASNGSVTVSTTGASTVAGSNTQVQFNDSGSFGASSDFTYDKNNRSLILSGSGGVNAALFINTSSYNPNGESFIIKQIDDGARPLSPGVLFPNSLVHKSMQIITGSSITADRLVFNLLFESNVHAGTVAESYNGVIGIRGFARHRSEASTTGQGITGVEGFASVEKPETSSTAGHVNIQKGFYTQLGWGNANGLDYSGSINRIRGFNAAYLNPSSARTVSSLTGLKIGLSTGVFGGAGVTDVFGVDINPLSGSGIKLGVRTYDPIVIGASNIIGSEMLRVSGSSYFESGSALFTAGLSGSLTQLTDGTSYLVAGDNITITSSSNGQITITGLAGDITSVIAGNGLLGGGTSGDVTLDINDSIVATVSGTTFTGAVNFNAGLSGSLTQLTDGTSYLIAGSGVNISSASNGSITVSTTEASTVAGSNTQVQFNDGGIFGASPGFTFDKTNDRLFVSGSLLVGATEPYLNSAFRLNQVVTSSTNTIKVGAYIEQTLTGSGEASRQYGLIAIARNKGKTDPGGGTTGFLSYGYHQSTSSQNVLWGYLGGAVILKPDDSNTAGTVDSGVGLYAGAGFLAAENFTGSYNVLHGLRVTTSGINASRTVGTLYGARIQIDPAAGVTNAYGIDISALTSTNVRIGIRTQDPIVVGASNVVGTEKLRISGSSYFDDKATFALGLSGSLTQLTDGTSYLVAGDGIEIVTGSAGQITVSQNVEWNENLAGTVDGVNTSFTLAYPPSDTSSIMLFVNGVLYEHGADNDYTVSGTTVLFNEAPVVESKITATYSR